MPSPRPRLESTSRSGGSTGGGSFDGGNNSGSSRSGGGPATGTVDAAALAKMEEKIDALETGLGSLLLPAPSRLSRSLARRSLALLAELPTAVRVRRRSLLLDCVIGSAPYSRLWLTLRYATQRFATQVDGSIVLLLWYRPLSQRWKKPRRRRLLQAIATLGGS
jgi:hypothetical protein